MIVQVLVTIVVAIQIVIQIIIIMITNVHARGLLKMQDVTIRTMKLVKFSVMNTIKTYQKGIQEVAIHWVLIYIQKLTKLYL